MPPQDADLSDGSHARSALYWFFKGCRNIVSPPAAILMAAFVGFASLARESGVPIEQAALMTATIWALPSMVVLIGAMTAGASLPAAALAVALSAVRLLPMTVAWVPVIRDKDTPRWQIFLLSHFVAVTAWVFAMAKLPDLPRSARVPFFAGFVTTLTSTNIAVTIAAYLMVERLPTPVAAALFLLTPIYFLLSLWGASRLPSDKAAMIAGLALGPVFFVLTPGLDLLWSGLVGGSLAYAAGRFARRAT